VNLWTVGCADARLTAQARSPMDKLGKTPRVSPTLPTGRRLPTSFTAPQQQQGLNLIPGAVKPSAGYRPYLFFPEPVQTTGTTAKYHRPVPAADLLISDPYKELMSEVDDVKDLGSGVLHGLECDHLAFRTKEVDWQIWIAQGARPYPCRYVITSKKVTGWPQYAIDIWAWKTGAEVASDGFKLEIPTSAKQLTPGEVAELNEIPALFSAKGVK
jgi:hypothetical protein